MFCFLNSNEFFCSALKNHVISSKLRRNYNSQFVFFITQVCRKDVDEWMGRACPSVGFFLRRIKSLPLGSIYHQRRKWGWTIPQRVEWEIPEILSLCQQEEEKKVMRQQGGGRGGGGYLPGIIKMQMQENDV